MADVSPKQFVFHQVGGLVANVSASFVRPATTPTYSSGKQVANSASAAAATPFKFANVNRIAEVGGMIRKVRLFKSGAATLTAASFRLHLWSSLPVPVGGDTDTLSGLINNAANYVGNIDVTIDKLWSDGATGWGVPAIGSEITLAAGVTDVWGMTEARAAYVGVTSETFTWTLEVFQQ